MFILKPLKSNLFSKDDIGTIEEVVRDSRLVDKGIKELEKFSHNAPSFDPERRRFLKYVAVLAGLTASGKFLEACSTIEPVQYQGKSYGNWEAWLLSQDLIRGPGLILGRNGLPNDHKNHVDNPWDRGLDAVDYDVGIGTPITPTADNSYSSYGANEREGKVLHLLHRSPFYGTTYGHLDKFVDIIYEGKPVSRGGRPFIDNTLDKLKIIAFSGATGVGPGGGGQSPHLHFRITSTTNNQYYSSDPFTLGIDTEKPYGGVDQDIPYGRRPVYFDGKTETQIPQKDRPKRLQESLDTLEKRVRESDLDNATKEELLKRHNNPMDLRDYLGYRVLEKKKGKDGKERYEFMPGSFMYSLMLEFYSRTSKQEFIAMLPFIFPPLKEIYQKANPGVQF